ncbi:mitochondrial ribosome protein 63 domain-containing protein [Ditylenchus destructor]|nr:mitochondrial ribosome protein 63 domain-containing protein [Ditylenchus destructor]
MRLTSCVSKCLNKRHWDRRIWEVGYRGSPLPQVKPYKAETPLKPDTVTHLKNALEREYKVMQWLSNPYITEEKERPYVEARGDIIDQWKQKVVAEKQAKMPGKGKRYTVDGRLEKRRANVGNNLQNHVTVEDSLKELIRRDRWA